MEYRKLALLSQVKSEHLIYSNVNNLFNRFKIAKLLKLSGITKAKGHTPVMMLYQMLLLILDRSNSVNSGLNTFYRKNLKTPINDMLNNEYFNWRKLLYLVSAIFIKTYMSFNKQSEPVLIIDDTSKKKAGSKVENIAWFFDHCQNTYYKGYQVVAAALSLGRLSFILDFEFKIGKSKLKHAAKTSYPKGSHTEQRERMGKQDKNQITRDFIGRIMKRRIKFNYLLWDSWYSNYENLKYICSRLLPKGIHLVAMVKRDNQKYDYYGKCMTIKQIYKKIGKWQTDPQTNIKFKSAQVAVLDKLSSKKAESRSPLIEVTMCFYRYPKTKQYRTLICTDLEKSPLDVLTLYLRRWSVEVIFQELKGLFGFDQSKSSKYAAQIADLTIRCVFYTMFCSLRASQPQKTTQQLLVEFYKEIEEVAIDILLKEIFACKVKEFLNMAKKYGYKTVEELLDNVDEMLISFFAKEWHENNVVDVDIGDFTKKYYNIAA